MQYEYPLLEFVSVYVFEQTKNNNKPKASACQYCSYNSVNKEFAQSVIIEMFCNNESREQRQVFTFLVGRRQFKDNIYFMNI